MILVSVSVLSSPFPCEDDFGHRLGTSSSSPGNLAVRTLSNVSIFNFTYFPSRFGWQDFPGFSLPFYLPIAWDGLR